MENRVIINVSHYDNISNTATDSITIEKSNLVCITDWINVFKTILMHETFHPDLITQFLNEDD